jgi:macrolide transport system ATP-binding/permease protein
VLAIAILALATGASTAVFSVVNAVLLRPLAGVKNPARLVTFYRTQKGDSFDNFSYPDYLDLRTRSRSLSGIAAHSSAMVNFRHGATERVRADLVTDNYFTVLGVQAAAGRLLQPQDPATAIVLSFDFWQRKFGGSPEALGAKVTINGFPFTVIGVASRQFTGAIAGAAFDLWAPLASQPQAIPRLSADILSNRAAGWIDIFGRLAPDVSVQQTGAEMKTIAQQLAQEYPITNGSRSVMVTPGLGWYPDDRAEAGSLLRLLGGAVALLSLIACANLAGLFLVRAAGRQREIALRLAVGAGRARVVRLLLAEGMIVAIAAGTLGLLLSGWAAKGMASIRPSSAARNLDVGLDGRVLAFALVASIAAGLLFALLPALRSVPRDLTIALKHGAPGSGFRRSGWRAALMVAQVAFSFVLLASAGWLVHKLHRLLTTAPGYATSHIAMGALDLTLQRYSEDRGLKVYRQLLQRLPALPGVVSATLASSVPPAEWPGRVSIFHPGEEPPTGVLQGREFELGLRVDVNNVAPRYFETLGVRLLAGRDFTLRDDREAPLVAVVNQALAARMWPGENPIGKRFAWPLWSGPRRPPVEVVGVAADTRSRALDAPAVPLMYTAALQNYNGRTFALIRTRGNSAAGMSDLERTVSAIDPDLSLFGVETMDGHVAKTLWAQRMSMVWIGAFSLLALGLTAVGLFGVIAQAVAQRRREVGIRMALGAAPAAISRLVLKEGMILATAGIGIGLPLAVFRLQDELASAAAAMILAAVLLAACWIPARRAAKASPVEALRD